MATGPAWDGSLLPDCVIGLGCCLGSFVEFDHLHVSSVPLSVSCVRVCDCVRVSVPTGSGEIMIELSHVASQAADAVMLARVY